MSASIASGFPEIWVSILELETGVSQFGNVLFIPHPPAPSPRAGAGEPDCSKSLSLIPQPHEPTPAMSQPHVSLFFRALQGGGAERIIANLARGLAERGYGVDLVLTRAEGIYLADLPPRVRVIALQEIPPLYGGFQSHHSSSSLGNLLRLGHYLQQERPLVLLGATHFINEVAIVAKHLARVPTKVWVAEHTTLSLESQGVEQTSSRYAPTTARWLYPWADGIIAVSQGVAQDLATLIHLPPSRIQVIYNPVLTPELYAAAQAGPHHPWLAQGQDPPVPVILGVGRFVAQKDFATLIRAVAQVRQRRSARLILMGGGRQQAALQALAHDLGIAQDVAILDFVANPYALMARSAVFVQSSRWEGLPTVLIEALALGLPIVATDCPSGAREILRDGRYGTLVPIGRADAMARAIEAALGWQGAAPALPESWLQQFQLETAVQRYSEVLGLP